MPSLAEFKKYLEKSDSFGDAYYFCDAEHIEAANQLEEDDEDEI